MTPARAASALLGAALFGALGTACRGGGDDVAAPRVDLIDDAVAAVEDHYGAPQAYFEISADLEAVGFVVAIDDDGSMTAEQGTFREDDGLTGPEPVGEADGETFTADEITFDPDAIFDDVRNELDDPAIVDFAIQGGAGDAVIYDATVAGAGGGVLLVLLGPDGTIRGVQGE